MRFTPRILVVDDEPQMLEFLSEVLRERGADPNPASSSVKAAELVNQEKFDAVFLDWMMPEMDGLRLAQEVRQSKSNSLCPIVMITGNPEPDAIRQCFRAGINFFLQKPVAVEQIQNLVTSAQDLMRQERLRYQRIPVEMPVECSWQMQSFEQKTEGKSINLSTTGMLARLEVTPAPASLVTMSFTLPKSKERLSPAAFVVRVTSDRDVAVRLINLTRDERWKLMEFSESFLE